MTTWFVTRHPGAVEWAARRDLVVDRLVSHLNTDDVEEGDEVIGTLPINLVAEVCARGGSYLHLSLRVPETLRGQELSADQLDACGARIERYDVRRLGLDSIVLV